MVSIYEGDMAYYVNELENFKIVFHGNIQNVEPFKYFSTKEAAESYVLHNEKRLSVNDIETILKSIKWAGIIPILSKEILELAKYKTKQND